MGGGEGFDGVGEGGSDDGASGGASGFGARFGVLEDDAVRGREAEEGCSGEVGCGVGFALGDELGMDEVFGDGKSGHGDTDAGQVLCGRCDDSPAVGGERSEECVDAGENGEADAIGEFDFFDESEFGFGVKIGAEKGDGFNGADAVDHAEGVGGVDATEVGPLGPTAVDGFDGGDENAVHVKKDAATGELDGGGEESEGHGLILIGGVDGDLGGVVELGDYDS